MASLAPVACASAPCTELRSTKEKVFPFPSAVLPPTVFVPESLFLTVPATALTTSCATRAVAPNRNANPIAKILLTFAPFPCQDYSRVPADLDHTPGRLQPRGPGHFDATMRFTLNLTT